MKKPMIASGVLVALLILAALIAPSFIDWNSHRPEVTEAVHQFTGLDISVEGDLSFRLLPSPALSARALTLANVEGGIAENFLVVEGLDINVDIFSLLGGDIKVNSILLDTPVIALELDAQGRANWDMILAGGEEGEESARDISLDRFVIQDGIITFRDAATGTREELTQINATISAKSISGPLQSSGTFRYRDVPLAIDAAIGQMTPGRRTPIRMTVAIAGQTPGITFDGSAMLDEGARQASGRLTIQGSNLGELLAGLAKLGGGAFHAPINLAHGYGLDADLVASEECLAINPVTFKVASTTGEGRIILELGEAIAAEASISVTTVRVEDWLPALDEENGGDAAGNGDEDFTLPANVTGGLEVTVGAVEYREGIARQVSVIVKMQDQVVTLEEARALLPGGSDLVLTGALTAKDGKAEFAGRLRAASNNLRGLASWLGYDTAQVPEGQLANFALDGAVHVTGNQARLFDAKASLDITEATGSASIALGGGAGYAVDVSFGRLNLDSYLAPAAESDDSWQATTDRIRAALKPLAEMNASVKLKGAQLTLSGASISGVTLDAALKDGVLSLSRLAMASMEGVRIDLRGRIRRLAGEPNANLAIDIESPNVNRFVRWSKMDLPIEAAALSKVAIKGKLAGTLKDLEVDLSGVAARGAYRIKGTLGGLSPAPSKINVEFEIGHSSHTDMIRRLKLPIEVAGEGQTARIYGTLEGALNDLKGNIRLEALGAKASISGRYAGLMGEEGAPQSFDLSLALSHANLTELVRYFDQGFAPSGGALGPVQAVVALKGTDKNFSLSGIQATLGPVNLKGGITVDRAGERPNINGAMKAGSLPLDLFMKKATAGVAEAGSGGERWSRKPLDLAMLRDFDAALEFSAEEISFRDYNYSEPAMTINLNNGVLTVPHFRSGMFDGTAAVDIRFDTTTDQVALTIGVDLRDVDVARLMPAFFGFSAATGKMSLAGQFSGAGRSQFEIISSLAGQAQFLARDGAIQKLSLGGVGGILRGGFNPLQLGGQLDRAARDGQTAYRQIEAPITVANGIVRIPPTETMTEQGDLLRGGGTINLPAWTIALGGEFRIAEFQSFPPVPYEVTGDIDNAKVKYRWNQFVAQAAKDLGANVLQGVLGSGGGQDAITDLTGGRVPLPLLGRKPAGDTQAGGQTGESSLLDRTSGSGEQTVEQANEPTGGSELEEVAKGIVSLLGGKKKDEQPPAEDDGGN